MKKILALVMAVAMIATFSTVLFAVEKVDGITGDLTVTGFFGEKTDAVELKDGESVTFKFNAKSNGTNNWDNYVLAVVSAVGDAYTGSPEEIVILRADNWGWGGGASDFVDGNTDGNKVAFESNISDWDAWKAAMQAGCAVEITLSKSGNTITYDAKMGDYTSKFTGTSGKDLPETVYAFFTGENCSLTGITTTKGTASTENPGTTDAPATSEGPATAPQTGFATIALAVAAVASGAYVVSKKRH